MATAQRLHTPEQLDEKRIAVQTAAGDFARSYLNGDLSYKPEQLYNAIESLHELVRELRRG
jgi:hypothetical protein